MSEVLTQRRPMAGLDETIGRLSPSFFDERKDGYLLAELLRIIADQVEPHGQEEAQKDGAALPKPVFPDQASVGAGAPASSEEPADSGDCAKPPIANAEEKRTVAQVPRIGGDFAAIEAGLLGGLAGDDAGAASQTGCLNAAASLEAAPDCRCHPDNNPSSSKRNGPRLRAGVFRPRHLIIAIAAAGLAGVAFNIFDGPLLRGPEHAVGTRNMAEMPETVTPAGSAPAVLEAARAGTPPAEPEAPLALAAAQRDISSVAAAGTAEPPPKAPEPVSTVAPAGADAPQAIAPQPESPLTASAASAQDTIEHAPPPAQQPAAAVNVPAANLAAELVKPSAAGKARHSSGQGRSQHVTRNAKASSSTKPAAGPVPAPQSKTEVPAAATQSAAELGPSAKDPFAAVQGALSSLASAAAKLFEQPAK